MRNINWYIWSNFSPLIYQKLYGTMISILYNIGENIVAIFRIYGSRAIFLLFYNHQDTESESQEMVTSVVEPI